MARFFYEFNRYKVRFSLESPHIIRVCTEKFRKSKRFCRAFSNVGRGVRLPKRHTPKLAEVECSGLRPESLERTHDGTVCNAFATLYL